MKAGHAHFSLPARFFHWLMAPLIVAMLFIGVGMVATVSRLHLTLIAIHRPLGIAIFVLVVLRLIVRITHRPPPLPNDMPGWQRCVAHGSHWLLYLLLFAMPLVGWSMLSAGGFPVHMFPGLDLPPIVSQNPRLYAFLRGAHTWLAMLLFVTFLGHLAAAMFHGLIRRDGVFSSMARGNHAEPAVERRG
ncbi:cytochrome b [Paraburkholderia edwinii]|uniref:Cytochrome b n=1 Tax=Paraburkholderia edwinii TaxID=2861782 RepID=A0ABX8UTY7_9BURK|nr:cytochrome b [Paraburkholderia edwinii]QYD72483.1 cytochrome b [Paraburkholderia edwinii]